MSSSPSPILAPATIMPSPQRPSTVSPAPPSTATAAAPTSPAPTNNTTITPVPVFAPRPLRLPSTYFPQRGVLLARTPSPSTSRRNSVVSASGRRSRSSSIASSVTDTGEGGDQMVRLYSPGPSHDVLDDFLKLVRQNNGTGGRYDKGNTTSPLSFRGSAPQQQQLGHRKQWSGSDSGAEKMIIPASPVSRTLTRNPMIYNTQFGQVQEES